jgi:hypothetical protein
LIPKHTKFTQHFIRENGLDGDGFPCRKAGRKAGRFAAWLLCPGMSYGALAKWWGDWGERDQPHVGVDLCLYRDGQGNVRRLDEKARIPAMYDGVVVHTCDDFLGRSVMMEHHLSEGGALYSMYGHTVPREDLRVGQSVREGEVVSRLAHVSLSKASVLPHLHVTLGWAPCAIAPQRLDWETIAGTLTLFDPLQAMDGPCQVIEPVSACRELVQALKEGSISFPGSADGPES